MKPYGIISDTHNHGWSAFSTVDEDGVNSRLKVILDETWRCHLEVQKAGGDTIYHAGDLFHVRGSIAPSVLNPTLDLYAKIIKAGTRVVLLPGNHDLEGKESNRVGSAVTALEGVGCKVANTPTLGMMASERVVLLPWFNKLDDLKAAIQNVAASDPKPSELDLIIHAPIDGVIPGLPDHGLTPEWLAEQGFRRIFAGHYHHHKHLYNGRASTYATDVYSVGALTHHSWSDVNSKAGFLIVSDAGVKWFKSHAPEFVELDAATDPSEVPLLVDGNYVRAKISSAKQSEVEQLRSYLTDCGAKGVVILPQKDVSVTPRVGSTVTAGASMEVSLNDYVKAQSFPNPEKLALLCQDILATARSAA